jgi:hypothetical protein
LSLIFLGCDHKAKSRYVEEWLAILSEPDLTSRERRQLWHEALAVSIALTARRFAKSWKVASAVTLVALVFSPFWMLTLLPLFLLPKTRIE